VRRTAAGLGEVFKEKSMKMMQQGVIFSPVALVVETSEEAEALWELARFTNRTGEPLSSEARAMAVKISNWFSNEAHL